MQGSKWNAVQRAAVIASVAVISLIFIGGLVRATGAGLGCPDWPRCWGSWWPPASAAEIQLENINRDKIPEEFRSVDDPRVFFNKRKMWIEYLNRLWGVLTGFTTIGLVVTTLWPGTIARRVRPIALLVLFLMLLQGWIGAKVVASGLHQLVITVHMVLAFAILALLLLGAHRAFPPRAQAPAAIPPGLRRAVAVLLVLTCVQVLLGTEVRALLDGVAKSDPLPPRAEWIDQVGWWDHLHRILSWAVLAAAIWLWRAARGAAVPGLRRLAGLSLAFVLIQLMLGVSLVYFALPPASQFLHLGVAACLFSSVFLLWLRLAPRPQVDPIHS